MDNKTFNLACRPRVDRRLSRLRILVVAALSLVMIGLAGWRLTGFINQQHSLRNAAAALAQRQDKAGEKKLAADKQIAAQQKIWQDRIDWANGLLDSTAPVLSRHLEQLETLLPERVRLDSLAFTRQEKGCLTLSVLAASGNDLFTLYQSLAGFELNVSSESTGNEGLIKADLTVKLSGGEG